MRKEKTEKGGKKRKAPPPILAISIEGEGLSLADVSLRDLVGLLEAAAAAVEAGAMEAGVDVPLVTLGDVREGSAAYHLFSRSDTAVAAVRKVCEAVETRGVGHSAELRGALRRLHEAGRVGSVNLKPRRGVLGTRRALTLAAPIEPVPAVHEVGAEVYARVVGLNARGDGTAVRLKLADGGTREFVAGDGVEASATRLFNKTVRARVAYEVSDGAYRASTIDQLWPWANDELLETLRDFRDELATKGETIDAEAWLAELDA